MQRNKRFLNKLKTRDLFYFGQIGRHSRNNEWKIPCLFDLGQFYGDLVDIAWQKCCQTHSLSFYLSLFPLSFLSRRVWIHLFSLSIACRDVCFRHSLIYDLSRYSNQEKERKFFCLIHSKMLISQLNWGQIWFGNVNVFIKIVQRVLKPFLFCIAFWLEYSF